MTNPLYNALCALLLSLLTLHCAHAGNTYKYRASDGTVVFSDVQRGGSHNRQYKAFADSSRATAKVSCSGDLDARFKNPNTGIAAAVARHASQHNVNVLLVKAVARIESCFDRTAVSTAGAKGLMQLMPATAGQYGIKNLFDVDKNVEAGVRYLSYLLQRFQYNHTLALAAYNAGPSAVEHYQGVPPFPETQKYVKRVLRQYRQYSAVASNGS